MSDDNSVLAEELARAERELAEERAGPATSAAPAPGLPRAPEEPAAPEPPPAEQAPDGMYWLKVRTNQHKQTKTQFAMSDGPHHTLRLGVVGQGFERVLVRGTMGAGWLPLEASEATQEIGISMPMRPGWNEVAAFAAHPDGRFFFERMPMARVPRPGEPPTLDFVQKPSFIEDMIRIDGLVLGEDVRRIEAHLVGTDRRKVFEIDGGGVHTFMVGIRVPEGRSQLRFQIDTVSGKLERTFAVERDPTELLHMRYGLRALLIDPRGDGSLAPLQTWLRSQPDDLVRQVRVIHKRGDEATVDDVVAAWAELVVGSSRSSYDRLMLFAAAPLVGGPALPDAHLSVADGDVSVATLFGVVNAAQRTRHTIIVADRDGEPLPLGGVRRTALLTGTGGAAARVGKVLTDAPGWTSLPVLKSRARLDLRLQGLPGLETLLPPAGARGDGSER
jgi:hypothetical protein